MKLICKFVKSQLQKKKSHYEKSWEMVKHFNLDVNIKDFKKKYGICGNPNNHFLQELFNELKKGEQYIFTLLQSAYLRQNAGTSAQEEENGQGFLDVAGVRFYTFYSMGCRLSSNIVRLQQN
jgi:hypothetical protein